MTPAESHLSAQVATTTAVRKKNEPQLKDFAPLRSRTAIDLRAPRVSREKNRVYRFEEIWSFLPPWGPGENPSSIPFATSGSSARS
jgi:hypothetical protein